MIDASTRRQLWRYGVVGLASNALLYVAYLALTQLGVEPKAAMTLLYAAGVAQTFFFNRRWSFGAGGAWGPALLRYAAAYALGYAVNLLALLALVDGLGWPHRAVQACMIVVVALLLFVLQKRWVFAAAPSSSRPVGLRS